jgi:uncharacterized membrane protein
MLREIVLLLTIVVAGTGGELCLTRAMKTIGEVHDFRPTSLLRVFWRALQVGWMWIALLLMTTGFENVSFVVPVTALSYAAGALGGKLFLGERVAPLRWAGVLLVCIGVTLVWIGKG